MQYLLHFLIVSIFILRVTVNSLISLRGKSFGTRLANLPYRSVQLTCMNITFALRIGTLVGNNFFKLLELTNFRFPIIPCYYSGTIVPAIIAPD